MSWNTLDAEVRATATAVLTPAQLDAWKLELAGYGTRRVAVALDISRSAATDRLHSAYRNLAAAGISQDASGHYRKDTAT